MDNDYETILLGLYSCVGDNLQHPRVIRIKSTAELKEIWASESLKTDILKDKRLKLLSDFQPFQFDENGNLF